jgi:uncharacterized protein involved in exopolysaccharide biosynthesis
MANEGNIDSGFKKSVSFPDLLLVAKKEKVTLFLVIVLSFIISVAIAISLPNIYRSETIVMANDQSSPNGLLGSLSGQFGGLASLAGINLSSGGTDRTGYALEVIKSKEFLYQFIESYKIKLAIMAADRWEPSTNTLIFDKDVYDEESKLWVRDVSFPFQPEPSLNETYKKIVKEHLFVHRNLETGMISISFSHVSPYIAKELLDNLIENLNQTIKQRDLKEAEANIQYIKSEMENTQQPAMKNLYHGLIEQQIQTSMFAKVKDDYVFKTVDRAVVEEEKYKPKRGMIVTFGLVIGFVLGFLLSFFRFTLKNGKGPEV